MASTSLILSSEYTRLGRDSRQLARRCAAGELRRLRHGVYVSEEAWSKLRHWDRYTLLVHATASTLKTRTVFCLQSAATLWGIPLLGTQRVVYAATDNPAGGRSKAGVRRLILDLTPDEVGRRDGLLVTTRERTVLDLAAKSSFQQAVVALDHVLKPNTAEGFPALARKHLEELAAKRYNAAANRRIRAALVFADAASGSPGESLSRAYMFLGGFRIPRLQAEVLDQRGLVAYLDFEWAEDGLAGEFDGLVKYRKPEYLQGRTASDVVVAEKRREDRIRATGLRVVRWTWTELRDQAAFTGFLDAAGVPRLPLRAAALDFRHRKGQPPRGST